MNTLFSFLTCVIFLGSSLVSDGALGASPSIYDLSINDVRLGSDQNKLLRFSWKTHSFERGYEQKAYQIRLQSVGEVVWDSGRQESDQSVLVSYAGKPLKPATDYEWQVRTWSQSGEASAWSEPVAFTTGLWDEGDWKGAKWIALEEDNPAWHLVPALHYPSVKDQVKDDQFGFYLLPEFQYEFPIEKKVKKALAFVCGLGHFELNINDQIVGNHFLDPGWTKYEKEAQYVTFDVTDQLKQGENKVNVLLGNGFYNIPLQGYFKLLGSFGAPKLKMRVRVEYIDGEVQDIVTDGTWQVTPGAITRSSIFSGEDYDARYTPEWREALVTTYAGKLKSQRQPPLHIREKIVPKKVFKNDEGQWVYDLGQNFSGIISAKMKGGRGQKLTFHPAELLNPDKSINQSASGRPFTFSYTMRGEGVESWQPRFTYYGFRYIQLENAVPKGEENPDGLPVVEELVGLHTCSSASEVGTFSCSNRLFNETYTLIDWAVRSNMASVLTDCPHREKLGWLEQAHLMQCSLQYRYDLSLMYHKIMGDMAASQTENGNIPTIAPEYVRFSGGFEDTPEWGSAFIICPWYVYKWYGDKSLLEKHYPAMQKMAAYLESRADQEGIVAYGLGDWFDLGPKDPGHAQLTTNGVTATALYYYDHVIMSEVARALDKPADVQLYQEKAAKIKEAFNKRYLKEDGSYDRNSQTANAIALYMGLVPEGKTETVLNHLKQDIRSRGNALTAGDVGYRYVLQSLRSHGESQLIYDMNSRYDVPGYGWQLAHGATALTESWQAYGFISNNHFMLGHLMEWLFNSVGGIDQTEQSVAWKEILINPQHMDGVTQATSSYQSPYGMISCSWEDTSHEYTMTVTIPANTEAIIYLPTHDPSLVFDYGVPLKKVLGIKQIKVIDKKLQLRVGSGQYSFSVKK